MTVVPAAGTNSGASDGTAIETAPVATPTIVEPTETKQPEASDPAGARAD